jgi:hypothetical protein
MLRRLALKLAAALAVACTLALPAAAQDVVLTIDGAVADGPVTFTDADLLALPQVEITTTTIWTEGTQRFSGPSLTTLLETVGAQGGSLTLRAINDYVVEMPLTAVEPGAPIIANRIDGEPFSVRDKGPLWLVFPYDSDERFRAESIYAYSVWQLIAITVN